MELGLGAAAVFVAWKLWVGEKTTDIREEFSKAIEEFLKSGTNGDHVERLLESDRWRRRGDDQWTYDDKRRSDGLTPLQEYCLLLNWKGLEVDYAAAPDELEDDKRVTFLRTLLSGGRSDPHRDHRKQRQRHGSAFQIALNKDLFTFYVLHQLDRRLTSLEQLAEYHLWPVDRCIKKADRVALQWVIREFCPTGRVWDIECDAATRPKPILLYAVTKSPNADVVEEILAHATNRDRQSAQLADSTARVIGYVTKKKEIIDLDAWRTYLSILLRLVDVSSNFENIRQGQKDKLVQVLKTQNCWKELAALSKKQVDQHYVFELDEPVSTYVGEQLLLEGDHESLESLCSRGRVDCDAVLLHCCKILASEEKEGHRRCVHVLAGSPHVAVNGISPIAKMAMTPTASNNLLRLLLEKVEEEPPWVNSANQARWQDGSELPKNPLELAIENRNHGFVKTILEWTSGKFERNFCVVAQDRKRPTDEWDTDHIIRKWETGDTFDDNEFAELRDHLGFDTEIYLTSGGGVDVDRNQGITFELYIAKAQRKRRNDDVLYPPPKQRYSTCSCSTGCRNNQCSCRSRGVHCNGACKCGDSCSNCSN